MEKTKLRYEVPEAETFVVRFEGIVCTSPDVSWDKSIKRGTQWVEDDEIDYGLE